MSFLRIRMHEQTAGEDGRLEETLRQILRVGGVLDDRRDEGLDRRVVPLGEFVERRGRLAAVPRRVREQIPRRRRELLADLRTLPLRVFRGQRT
jgi:hypothetical protein